MKKYLITLTCLLFATAMYCSSLAYADDGVSTGTDKGTGGGVTIICSCADDGESGRKCKASNNGNECAQSKEGGNIKCKEFNSNC